MIANNNDIYEILKTICKLLKEINPDNKINSNNLSDDLSKIIELLQNTYSSISKIENKIDKMLEIMIANAYY